MIEPAGHRRRLWVRSGRQGVTVAAGFVVAAATVGCGGGGGGGNDAMAPTTGSGVTNSQAVVYAHSQVLGIAAPQMLTYIPAVPPSQAALQSPNGGSLLKTGSTLLTAEYIPAALAGVRASCVSGNGTSIGVLDAINPGVVTVSAAVLLNAVWNESDVDAAWAAAAASAERWDGWENCGVKPEGTPFKSSTVTLAADRGYIEDIFVGNPSTNFTTLRLATSPADAAAMRRSGMLTTEDPMRPLRITWRVFKDGAGNTVWVERGEPAPGAPAATRGFITLFVPDRQR